jgi:hypothetical protein
VDFQRSELWFRCVYDPSLPLSSLCPSPSLSPVFTHPTDLFIKYLLNSYFVLVCARSWGLSDKEGHIVPSPVEPAVGKVLNSY